jgi:hypothetical protein
MLFAASSWHYAAHTHDVVLQPLVLLHGMKPCVYSLWQAVRHVCVCLMCAHHVHGGILEGAATGIHAL